MRNKIVTSMIMILVLSVSLNGFNPCDEVLRNTTNAKMKIAFAIIMQKILVYHPSLMRKIGVPFPL